MFTAEATCRVNLYYSAETETKESKLQRQMVVCRYSVTVKCTTSLKVEAAHKVVGYRCHINTLDRCSEKGGEQKSKEICQDEKLRGGEGGAGRSRKHFAESEEAWKQRMMSSW